MFKLNAEQARAEEEIRAAVFANEAHLLGLDPIALAAMGESAILRECAYRRIPVGNAAPVGPEAWRRLDDRATTIMRDVLQVFARLQAANSTPVSMGDIMSYFPQISDSGEASVTMDGRNPGRSDQALVKYVGTPVPIITSEVRMGWRQMEVIRKGGNMLDTESIANSQRKVAEKLEDLALNGDANVNVAGNTIYGLRNHPQRNTDTHGFDLNSTATGANWLAAFQKLINALVADNAYGRVTAFVNYSDWVYASINEFTSGYPKTILQRLREIEQIADIVPCGKVPADNILGVAGLETGNWGSILTGMAMTTRPKARHNPEDDYVFSVMAAAAPQLRTDYDGRAPFAHLTAA
jgi:uncharacterized linocin/CFP29 family protein